MRLLKVVVVGVGILAAQAGTAEEPILKSKKDKVSYAMAVGMAKTVQRQGVEIDVAVFSRGMYDVLQGGKLLMTQAEMKEVLAGVVSDMKEKQKRAQSKKKAADAKK
jgi:Domain amino terminal to FKBP-type peptidyl-prolyl isomerase